MSTVRDDILLFLHDPQRFAARMPPDRAESWRRGLTDFAGPRLTRPGSNPLMPAQVGAWTGLAHHRAGLLLGPPGTGKTHLLAWMALGYAEACRAAGQPCRVLATGFTRESMANLVNKAAEIAAVECLGVKLAFLGPPPDGALDRLVVPLGLRGRAGLKAGWEFLEAQEYAVVAATNWSLGKLLRSDQRPDRPELSADGQTARLFDLVLIDEASQALVSQGLMSLAGLTAEGRVVVCGDDRQLAPVRTTSEARVGGRELGGSLYRFLASSGVAEFALEDTFRLNAPLVEFPAREFYAGHRFASAVPERRLTLRDGWAVGLADWERLALDPDYPVVVLLHDGPPAGTDNPFERDLVARLVERLTTRLPPRPGAVDLDADTLWGKRLAVVTPHRAQNAAIRSTLRRTPLCARPRVETVDKVQGQERDVVIVGYGVSDPEFAQVEAGFLFDQGRLNVAITRAKGKLVLVVSRRLFEVTPEDEETFDAADTLRRFVYECQSAGARELPGPDGGLYRVEILVRGFGPSPPPLSATSGAAPLPVTRLTYPGDPPTAETLRERLALAEAEYLYVTATNALARDRELLAHVSQTPQAGEGNGKTALRFEELIRHLMRPRPVLAPAHQRLLLQRGIRKAAADPQFKDALIHDAPAWLAALNDLEARGEDVTAGVRPDLEAELTSPVLAPVLSALQRAYRAERPAGAGEPYEAAARRFLDTDFRPPPVVVMEGFAYLFPLQTHFVRRCLEHGSRVVFVHPQDPGQADAFAILDRTYAAYTGQTERAELPTDLRSEGHDLRLLQAALFAEQNVPPRGDGSATVAAYPHRHREVTACLEQVKSYLSTPGPEGRKPSAGSVAIVTRNGGEFLPVIQEEARRLGLLDRLRIEPRLLLLTPLGRFALTLYDLGPQGAMEVSAGQFETMIASGWLGGRVQRTVEAFAAARAQVFDRCAAPAEWRTAFDGMGTCADAPELARLPGPAVPPQDLSDWRTAFQQITRLHGRLFDGTQRSVTDHIRRLREELSRLNPDKLRNDERELVERILAALQEVVGSAAIELDAQEMGELMAGMARGEPDTDEEVDPGKVWVTTPEGIDSSPRDVVFYLGVDSSRVPRPAVMPWPFFAFDPSATADRERYLFLAVVRAARKQLHLSYFRRGEDETYEPSPYLVRAARLLGREDDLKLAVARPAGARPPALQLPVLPGRATSLDLYDVAAFGLCPYRFRLERFDPTARRFREKFQLRFVALGVWMERTFGGMLGRGQFRDAQPLRDALYAAARDARDGMAELFPAFGQIGAAGTASADWEGIRQHLKGALDGLVDWLAEPNDRGTAKLDYGVTFVAAPTDAEFQVDLDDRLVTVRTGLRHAVRAGQVLYALPDALTYQNWLLPSYRADPNSGGPESVEGVEVFPGVREAVAWWSEGIRVALAREKFPDPYLAFRDRLASRVGTLQAGRYPKHPGDHCELCPVRHACLGVTTP